MTESKCECPKCNCDKESVHIPGRYELAKMLVKDPETVDLAGPLMHDLLCKDCSEGLHVGLDNKQERI